MESLETLIQFAAKAEGRWNEKDPSMGLLKTNGQYWNPLQNNEDAFVLGVKLGFTIEHYLQTRQVEVFFPYCDEPISMEFYAANFEDPTAATRRAIVRAAAMWQYLKEQREREQNGY